MWGILDKLRKNEAVVESCQHWWDLNKNDAISTLDVGIIKACRDYFEMRKPEEDLDRHSS